MFLICALPGAAVAAILLLSVSLFLFLFPCFFLFSLAIVLTTLTSAPDCVRVRSLTLSIVVLLLVCVRMRSLTLSMAAVAVSSGGNAVLPGSGAGEDGISVVVSAGVVTVVAAAGAAAVIVAGADISHLISAGGQNMGPKARTVADAVVAALFVSFCLRCVRSLSCGFFLWILVPMMVAVPHACLPPCM